MRTLLILLLLCCPSRVGAAVWVELHWTTATPTDLSTHFEVFRSVTGNTVDFYKLATTASGARVYEDHSIAPNVLYYYYVRQCITACCCSLPGPTVTITTPATLSVPARPLNLRVME